MTINSCNGRKNPLYFFWNGNQSIHNVKTQRHMYKEMGLNPLKRMLGLYDLHQTMIGLLLGLWILFFFSIGHKRAHLIST